MSWNPACEKAYSSTTECYATIYILLVIKLVIGFIILEEFFRTFIGQFKKPTW